MPHNKVISDFVDFLPGFGPGVLLEENGFAELSSGLILQWGVSDSFNVDNAMAPAVAFEMNFPNTCLQVGLTTQGTGTYTGAGPQRMGILVDFDVAGFSWYLDAFASGGQPIRVRYFAVGF